MWLDQLIYDNDKKIFAPQLRLFTYFRNISWLHIQAAQTDTVINLPLVGVDTTNKARILRDGMIVKGYYALGLSKGWRASHSMRNTRLLFFSHYNHHQTKPKMQKKKHKLAVN